MLKKTLKLIYYSLVKLLPDFWLANKANILMYHSISDENFPFSVQPAEFEKQMEYLAEKHYNVVSLEQLAAYLQAKRIPAKTVGITFDDGYEDNYSQAFPILKKYNLPATIFVATGWLNNSANKYDKQCLSPEQMKEMLDSRLVDFQPHSISHPKLTKLKLDDAAREIAESKSQLEKLLARDCQFFAYPYGRHNDDLVKIVEKNNFKLSLATSKGLVSPKSPKYSLNRNAIDRAVSLPEFKGIIKVGRI